MGSGRARCDDELRGGQLFVSRAHGAAGDAKLGCEVLPGWQTRSRCEHAALDGGADAFADLLGQRRLRRSIKLQLQRLGHAALVHDFCAFLVLFSGPKKGIYTGQGKTGEEPHHEDANLSSAQHAPLSPSPLLRLPPRMVSAKKSRRTSSRRYPTFPASRWSPWSSTMRRAGPRLRISTQNRPSSSPMSFRDKSNRR